MKQMQIIKVRVIHEIMTILNTIQVNYNISLNQFFNNVMFNNRTIAV